RDEGIGPRAVELLATGYEFPDNVEVIDAGTMDYMILDTIRGFDRLIVVDAVKGTDQPAGTVMLLTPEDLAENNQVMHSMHDIRITDVLSAAALVDRAPKTSVVGMQIESIAEWVLELSEPCESALPVAVAAVIDELRAEGVEPTPRADKDVHARIIEALRTYEPMPSEALRPSESAE
ncbi:MAG: hydrogenase maturation protease, partial [Actinobacteria bacterium]